LKVALGKKIVEELCNAEDEKNMNMLQKKYERMTLIQQSKNYKKKQ